jgi:hypothetical protein
LRKIGNVLLVAPHMGLCPLKVVARGCESALSDHDRLFADMAAQGVGVDVPEVATAAETSKALALEDEVVARSENFLESTDYCAFADVQISLTKAAGLAEAQEEASSDRSASDFQARLCDVLDAQRSIVVAEDGLAAPVMIASTGLLRSELLLGSAAAGSGHRMIHPAQAPHALLALDLLIRLARSAGLREVTFQTVRLFLDNLHVLFYRLTVMK